MRLGRAADRSPPSSAAVMEELSYTSTHPLGHTGPVTGSLLFYQKLKRTESTERYSGSSVQALFTPAVSIGLIYVHRSNRVSTSSVLALEVTMSARLDGRNVRMITST